MSLFSSLWVCFFILCKQVVTHTITDEIDVVVFLPQNDTYLFSYARVAPAIRYAQMKLKTTGAPYSDLHFNIHFENSNCVNDAVFNLVDRSCEKKPDLILGPVCEYEAAPVVRLASHWNIPVISAGALATSFSNKTTEYSHLTRIAPSYVKMAETFSAMFRHLAWKTAVLLYEDDKEEQNCYFTVEGIYLMTDLSMKTYALSHEVPLDTDDIIQSIYDTQVVILCMDANKIREIMLAAHRRRLTSGTHMFFNIELFNASSYGNGSWWRGDKFDNEARQAYAYLNTVTLLRTVKPEFENFSMEIKAARESMGLHNCKDCESVNMFVEGFHDALLLYAIALKEAMKSGYSKKNGLEITSRMRNRTFEGIAGQVSMDDNGDRNGDFSLMAMTNVNAGTYEVVANYFGLNKSFQLLPAFNYDHFTLQGIQITHTEISDKSCGLGMSALTGVIVGALLGTAMLTAFYFFRKNYRITIERRAHSEACNTRKHRHLREDSIRSNLSAA
ncbi:atrial natriuretic peptide receptor 3 isoform X1 [Corythoichthys intestinalis]|uniref:atrial natriuretic peptide receptor 3 isoform X1 n=1 Tax=Corythoichthys intestinalis TaxID=161448 RepID=UPI0025A62795|nr:atrial natriuretic peptide receptor 3 isoform X1 [Corythoichthys intestinalis]XP_061804113.1 atrial natriuretic peptide receptor 3-like [Nerophis lumbriciformis]